MSRYDDDEPFFTQPRDRAQVVAENLARLITHAPPDPPAVAERKRQEAAARLRRHDELFGLWPGCTLGVPPPWEVGDPEGDRDVG